MNCPTCGVPLPEPGEPTDLQVRMLEFGVRVLEILEEHGEDWGADTLDEIAAAAYAGKLATCEGDECLFKMKRGDT